jgi:hypothetical protein
MRRTRVVMICALAAALVTGCGNSSTSTTSSAPATAGATSTPAQASPAGNGWTGMGAPLPAFETAHPKNLTHCPAGTCFGSQLTNSEGRTTKFTTLQTTGGSDNRVDGYTQAFADGTNVDEAKSQVLALMPKDAKTTAFFIQYDSNGATCAFWNIKSATLGKWFSGPKVGDSTGVLGIELSTLDSSGNSVYEASHVTTANVSLAQVDHSTNC